MKINEHVKLEQLDQNKFIEANNLKEVTNPIMFRNGNRPTPDGLLSYEIFGITNEERAGIYAYIDLYEYFIQPYYYKIWLKIDKNLRACVYETQNFIINSDGYLIPDDNGETGLEFLRKNIDKIRFKNTKRDIFLNALMDAKKKNILFTNKLIVIPPFYRDVNTSNGRIGVGECNKLYINILNSVRSLKDSSSYGLSFIGGNRGKLQDMLQELYNWFTVGETIVGGAHTGSGLFKKMGYIRRAGLSKTTDNSARLVISSPNNDVNSKEDLMVDLDYSAVPLSAALVIAYPFIIHYLRNWFLAEFSGQYTFPAIDKNGEIRNVELDNPLLEFSDDRFDREMNEFIHGYSNRIKPIFVPNTEGLEIALKFKAYKITPEQYKKGIRETGNTIERELTWVDLFYMAACHATKDKMCVITRYPMDSYFNQLYTKMHISCTIETEPVVINGELYRWYPKISQKDIGSNTANKFIDTLSMTNPYCILMGADYDGDQITVKMPYSVEANKELEKYANSKAQFVTVAGENGRTADKTSIQAIYSLTNVLDDDRNKLTDPEF